MRGKSFLVSSNGVVQVGVEERVAHSNSSYYDAEHGHRGWVFPMHSPLALCLSLGWFLFLHGEPATNPIVKVIQCLSFLAVEVNLCDHTGPLSVKLGIPKQNYVGKEVVKSKVWNGFAKRSCPRTVTTSAEYCTLLDLACLRQ